MFFTNGEDGATGAQLAMLRAAVEQARTAMVFTDPHRDDNPIVFMNPAFEALTGYPEEEVLGRNCRFLQGPDTDPAEVRRIASAIAERRLDHFELLNYRRDGTQFWNALHVGPVFDEEGRLVHFFGSQWDVTEKVEAVRALRGQARLADERLQAAIDEVRRLRVGLDEAREAVVITEHDPIDEPGPRIVYASRGFERITGYRPEEVIGRSPRFLQGPDTDRAAIDEVRRHLETDEPLQSRTLNYRRDGTPFWLEWSITPIHDEAGRPTHWLSVQRDVTDEVEVEEQRRLLFGELDHRMRNLFSLVLGVAGARPEEGQSLEGFQAALVARLRALVAAHGLVFTESREGGGEHRDGARMDELAAAVLRPMGDEERIRLEGPRACLGSHQALNAALLLHELGTNALKHGALSVPDGGVDLRWRVEEGELRLDWTEAGGPIAHEPDRRGFGSRLIRTMVEASSRTDAGVEYPPEGLRCRVGLPAE